MEGSCGSFVFTRMDGNEALREIFFSTHPPWVLFPSTEKVSSSGLGHALFGAISLVDPV
jgi:hypothetical protein